MRRAGSFSGGGQGGPSSDEALGLGQRVPQDLLHLVELRLAADERWSDLHDHVAAVVGAAVQAVVEQRAGQEAADQPLPLRGVERLPGGLVLDQLDGPEVAVAAEDRKSTRLNSSHANISYAVFCLKKKK